MNLFEAFGVIGFKDNGFSDGIDKAKKKTDEFGEKSKSSTNIMEGLGKGLKVVGAVAATSAAVAGAAAVKLGIDVITAFADYEQLVGGVDTLFKDSSQKLQDYASVAYKTAGLSGNQYMETVTSFSASLIQSLGGDTERAVEYANMAVIDMSDNANKMGTSIGDIQNAYQGFAKENYTIKIMSA